MSKHHTQHSRAAWRRRLFVVIFESDTPAGKAFDVALLVAIVLSIVVVSLDSVATIRTSHGPLLIVLEWIFTLLFTIEYILRLISARRPLSYAISFFGIVDLISVLPTYLSLFLPGTRYLLVVRILRLLRVFRILKMAEYLSEATVLRQAMQASQKKISVFLLSVVTIVVIVGALMYVVEGEQHGFTDIPTSMYWAIVTLTTVGYGDISPQTTLGKTLASIVMLLGYAIIAVPTGIVTGELSKASSPQERVVQSQQPDDIPRNCPVCEASGHDNDATYCKYCGEHL